MVCIGVWARRVGCRSYVSGGMPTLSSQRSLAINHDGLLARLCGALASGELVQHNGLPVAREQELTGQDSGSCCSPKTVELMH